MVFQSDPYSVLLVSASEKFNQVTLPLLPMTDYWPVTVVGSVSEARRTLSGTDFDLVIVNASARDQHGVRLAMEISAETDAAVLLLIPHEIYEETYAKTRPYGVVTLSKPTNTQMLGQNLRMLCAMRERLRRVRQKQVTVEEKIEEMRLVNRAKWALITREQITEPEAHRRILQQAMEGHQSKRQVAEAILLEAEDKAT